MHFHLSINKDCHLLLNLGQKGVCVCVNDVQITGGRAPSQVAAVSLRYLSCSDAPIRHWRIIGRSIIGAQQSADYRLIQTSLFCCLISVIYLGSDCYPRTLTYLKDC